LFYGNPYSVRQYWFADHWYSEYTFKFKSNGKIQLIQGGRINYSAIMTE
jgi:hypothetical protein